ncbi:MAG TPA: tRNA preQ1(34) S-adenosylmethionine ribosyltransferase-isomerase QueA [Candidatus Bipolaricaulota bacterium]|nr:tRNA preQ1(34) S-adenosylmethionine ribosyltransferase-isomerase QueA [Candidatus Bipolaricaulota bacterium]
MRVIDFNFNLPKNLIAQKPATPRDSSRLLVYARKTKALSHEKFHNLDKYLNKGDLLVFNNTKVFPARLLGKKETGGAMEVFLLEEKKKNVWQALVKGKNKKAGQKIIFDKVLIAVLSKQINDFEWLVKFEYKGDLRKKLEKIGQVPLPPYIKSSESQSNLKKQYQTIYAKKQGSVAAPTAGFHFTEQVLKKLKAKGVKFAYVTLHVGLGTFGPLRQAKVEDNKLHYEKVEINQTNFNKINKAKEAGRRVITVGTTTARTLEGAMGAKAVKKAWSGELNTFIYPGYKFKIIDGLITNFHLPQSSLMMLVAALIGRTNILNAYKTAVKEEYRFYSFGDAMLIL